MNRIEPIPGRSGWYRSSTGETFRLSWFHDRLVRLLSTDDPIRLAPGEVWAIRGAYPVAESSGSGDAILYAGSHELYRSSIPAMRAMGTRGAIGSLDAVKQIMATANAVRDRIQARQSEGASPDDLAALGLLSEAFAALSDAAQAPGRWAHAHVVTDQHPLRLEAADGHAALDLIVTISTAVSDSAPGQIRDKD